MPPTPGTILGKVAFATSFAVGVYAVLLGALLTPPIQRFALYAHKINTLFLGDNLNDGEAFGFAKNQVTPFNIHTPDGETLYAWHVLPLDIYARHEDTLRGERRPDGPVSDFTQTTAFRLLTQDPTARVVVNCTSPSPQDLPRKADLTSPKKSTGTPATSPRAGGPIPTAPSLFNLTRTS